MDLITSRHFVDKQKGDGFLFGGRDAAGNSGGLEAMFGLGNWKRVCEGPLEQYPV